jgi:rubredoxin
MIVEKYKCSHCGYLYVYIDYGNGNKMNVPFEELEEDWNCPMCGLGKNAFKKIDV